LGRQLYQWLDGKEGWLRRALDEADEQTISEENFHLLETASDKSGRVYKDSSRIHSAVKANTALSACF
jgi:hypothetical protein